MGGKFIKRIKNNKGITGIDATIAVVILMIFVPLITTIISNTINIKEKMNRKITAVNIAVQAIESLKQFNYDEIQEGVISNDKIFDGKKGGHYVYNTDNFPKGYRVNVEAKEAEKSSKEAKMYKEINVTITYPKNVGDEQITLKTKIYE